APVRAHRRESETARVDTPLARARQPLSAVVVRVHPGLALGEACGAEGREVHEGGLALDHPLGKAAANGGGGLEARAGTRPAPRRPGWRPPPPAVSRPRGCRR